MVLNKTFRRILRTLNSLEKGFLKKALSLFIQLKPEIRDAVERVFRSGETGAFEMPGRKRYLALFERYIRELYVQGMTLAELEITDKRLKYASEISPDPIIPVDAVKWMDSWTLRFGENYYGDLTNDVVKVLKESLEQGWHVEETMDELSRYLTGPGYFRHRLEIIARTNATTAFNQGRLDMFRQNADFVAAVEFISILDSRTTEVCRSRHGKVWMLDDPALTENTPPLHFNCRSILSPIDRYTWEEMQKKGWRDEAAQAENEGLEPGEIRAPETLKEKLEKIGLAPVEKGFGDVRLLKLKKEEAEEDKKRERLGKVLKGRPDADEMHEDKVSYSSGVKIVQHGFDEKEVSALSEALESLPKSHLKKLKEVEITNSWLKRDSEKDLPSSIIGGYYAPEKRGIMISRHPNWNDIRIRRTPESTKHVFYHELGHHYERVLMSDEQKTELFKIHRLLKKNGVVSQPVEEFFAEVYCIYKTKTKNCDIINKWDEKLNDTSVSSLQEFLGDIFNE